SGDGGLAVNAQLNEPTDIAVDARGNVFILDSGNSRVREVMTNGVIRTVAGSGLGGFAGDGGLATPAPVNFARQGVLSADRWGNLFIADTGNNRTRKVLANGVIRTIAGNGVRGFGGDGGVSTVARLNNPVGVDVDAAGNLYIGDTFNNRVRKVVQAS